jgi:hypothetical protein
LPPEYRSWETYGSALLGRRTPAAVGGPGRVLGDVGEAVAVVVDLLALGEQRVRVRLGDGRRQGLAVAVDRREVLPAVGHAVAVGVALAGIRLEARLERVVEEVVVVVGVLGVVDLVAVAVLLRADAADGAGADDRGSLHRV